MDLVEYLKLGGKIQFSYKKNVKDWFKEISLTFLDNKPFFSNIDYTKYRKNLSEEESIYLLLSIYKHWDNLAYISKRLEAKNIYIDFEYLSKESSNHIKNEKELVKNEWIIEFSEEKLKSLEKVNYAIKAETDVRELLFGKNISEYFEIIDEYLKKYENLGCDVGSVSFHLKLLNVTIGYIYGGEDNLTRFNKIIKEKENESITKISFSIDGKYYSIEL